MLNFTLNKDKKEIFSEYFLRVFIYFFIFLFFAFIILFSLFMPSVFHSEYKKDNISQQLNYVKKQVGPNNTDSIEIIKRVNILGGMLIDIKTSRFSEIIEKIISLKNSGIKINSISVLNNDESTIKISINGLSKTRENLTSFDKELKKSELFQSVNLPVSNLIKNTEADFSMNLIYKK